MIRLKRFFRFQIRLSAKTWHLGPRLPHIFNFLIYCYGDTSTALIFPVCSYKVNEKPSKLTDDVGIATSVCRRRCTAVGKRIVTDGRQFLIASLASVFIFSVCDAGSTVGFEGVNVVG